MPTESRPVQQTPSAEGSSKPSWRACPKLSAPRPAAVVQSPGDGGREDCFPSPCETYEVRSKGPKTRTKDSNSRGGGGGALLEPACVGLLGRHAVLREARALDTSTSAAPARAAGEQSANIIRRYVGDGARNATVLPSSMYVRSITRPGSPHPRLAAYRVCIFFFRVIIISSRSKSKSNARRTRDGFVSPRSCDLTGL